MGGLSVAILDVLQDDRSELRQVCSDLRSPVSGPLVQKMLLDMIDTMRDLNGVGLAAPQVGWPVRVLIAQLDGRDFPPIVMIKPRILTAVGTQASSEGCLSVNQREWFSRPVRRFKRIQVTYTDERGVLVHRRLHGYAAAIVQHEIDHLDGILFTDRLKWQKEGSR